MNIEQINELWAKDCILSDDMFEESRRIPKLHQKYWDIYIKEAFRLKNERNKLTELTKTKTEYFRGQLDAAEIRQLGWPPLGAKILKEDVPMHVEADKDIIQQSLIVGIYDSKVKYIEDILKMIHSRNFIIKNAIEWRKFESGV